MRTPLKCPGRALAIALVLAATGAVFGAAPAIAAPPANDDFAHAQNIAYGSTNPGDTSQATRETGEPLVITDAAHAGPTVWYRWTAPGPPGDRITLSTCGGAVADTVIGVFVGTTLGDLSRVASGDDEVCGPRTSISFTSQAGVSYWIQVATYGGTTPGPFALTHQPALLPNANFFAAANDLGLAPEQPAFGGTLQFSNVGATKESGEPNHGGNAGGKSVWFKWQAPNSGNVTVNTCGSAFDTLLGVYTGTAVNALTSVAQSDDDNACGAASTQSALTFAATSGTVYRIAVDGFSTGVAASGSGVIRLSESTDTTAPTIIVSGGPSGTVTSTTATFFAGGTEYAIGFQCSLDGAAFGACSSGSNAAYSGLADGPHTFQSRGTDSWGNLGTSALQSWTVDTTPPDTLIDSGPPGPTGDSTPTFDFHSTEDSNFECSIDQGTPAFEQCPDPPGSYTHSAPLADGPYTFRVRATDAAVNTDQSPATRSFTVDTTAPDTVIDSGPTGATADSTPTFGFHSTEAGSSFECSIDQGTASFGACSDATANTASPALADGAYTFRVRATDPLAHMDLSSATRSFTVDTTVPPVVAPSPVPGPVTAAKKACKKKGKKSAAAAKKCKKKK